MSTGHGAGQGKTVNQLPPGIDRLPSGALRVRVYGPDGQRRTIGTYRSEKAAKDAHAKARAALLAGTYLERDRSTVTLDTWIEMWMPNRGVRPDTLRVDWGRYRLHIKPYLGDLPLDKITPYTVRTWLTRLDKDKRSIHLQKKAHTLLATALGVRGALGDERISSNPCVITRPTAPQRRRWTLLTHEQVDQIVAAATGQLRTIILLGAHGGLRWSEIAGLQAKDYDRATKTLRIARGVVYVPKQGLIAGPTKNHQVRTVPMSTQLVEALNEHLASHPVVADGWIFQAAGHPLAPHSHRKQWDQVRTDTGLTCRFHDLRHSCASLLLAGGATTAEVRDMLGHQSITTTELYLHIEDGGLAARVATAFG